MASEIASTLARDGFVHVTERHDFATLLVLARELGTVINETWVRLLPERRTYLTRPDPIPLHTDHPHADRVAWLCVAQDEDDGATLLVDGLRALANTPAAARSLLGAIELPAMVRLGDEAIRVPVVRRDDRREHVFYAPWLEPSNASETALAALRSLQRAVDEEVVHAIRLRPGDVLIVDNHRMLHGRARLRSDSARVLRRLWLDASYA